MSKRHFYTMRVNNYEQLKQLYIRKKHYRTRGLWGRTNNCFYLILRKYGYDAWKKAIIK
jgi:hypothetical protein